MKPDRRRQPVSIENLLVWAYADQMVHLARREALAPRGRGPLAAYSSLWSEAVPVEGGGPDGFDASPDAWRVHERVMELGRSVLDLGQDLAAVRYHALAQYRGAAPPVPVAASADRMEEGWPTNGILAVNLRTLVMLHASRVSRPPMPRLPDFRLKPDVVVRHPRQKGGVYTRGWFCHVVAEGYLPGDAAHDGALYRSWWLALKALRDGATQDWLTMWSVTDVLPPLPKSLG